MTMSYMLVSLIVVLALCQVLVSAEMLATTPRHIEDTPSPSQGTASSEPFKFPESTLKLLANLPRLSNAFAANCDLRTSNPGRSTPDEVLPSKAENVWLHAFKSDISKWYEIGKAQCEAYLETARGHLASSGHASYFPEHKHPSSKLQCRGRNTLLDYSGTILWPFGPFQDCPTYSKCWFGILSCGEPKNDHIKSSVEGKIAEEITKLKLPDKVPAFTKWSVKALNLLVRVVGAELVVPETKYVTLDNNEDVIIGQYVLTRAYKNTSLEARLFELYPSALFNWSQVQRDDLGLHNLAPVYLGSSEGRCKAWTKCATPNFSPECDQKSFVFRTPAAVNVTDGSSLCPASILTAPLPLCNVRDSSQAGRWISSELEEFTPHCETDATRNILFHRDAKHVTKGEHLGEAIAKHKNFSLADHHYKGDAWHEASGDPCLVNAPEPEDAGRSHWFYAPYACKYHFYNSVELHKCLIDQKLTHIHVAGDSLSRELFTYLSLYLGVPLVHEAELKSLSSDLQQKEVAFHSGQVLLSEGYSWDWNPHVMKLIEKAPLPNIYITNYAFEHRAAHLPAFKHAWNATEYQYWSKDRNESVPKPEFLIFQNTRELAGHPRAHWAGNEFRQDSAYLAHNYTALGFAKLDEFLFSTGRYGYHASSADGWHFGGTKRQMEVVALFNMVCNDWLTKVKK